MFALAVMMLLMLGIPAMCVYLTLEYHDQVKITFKRPLKYMILVSGIAFLAIRYTGLIPMFVTFHQLCGIVSTNIWWIILLILFINVLAVAWVYCNDKYKWVTFKEENKPNVKSLVITVLLFSFGFIIFATKDYTVDIFGNVSMQQLMFNLIAPSDGASTTEFNRVIYNPLLNGIIIILVFFNLVDCNYDVIIDKIKIPTTTILKGFRIFGVVCLVLSVLAFNRQFKVVNYIAKNFTYSKFIEDNYVSPNDVDITLNGNKKNLIHIYVESLESSFADEEHGGLFKENNIPNITKLANNNVSFTEKDQKDQLGGAICIDGTNWTSGGMTATELGIPLKIDMTGVEREVYGSNGVFLDGAIGLGNVLEQAGYKNVFYLGSDASFGGREALMQLHGNYEVIDYDKLVESGFIPEGYFVHWGVEDQKLFEGAKTEIAKLATTGQPFNFTTLTTGMHAPDGYLPEGQPSGDNQYLSAVQYNDQEIFDFITWCEQQPWFADTTIVITGDHTSMNSYSFGYETSYSFKDNVVSEDRRILNAFINANEKPLDTTKREFFTMDYMPTILGSLGFEIEGDRLALGTNLFSKTKTIAEEFGVKRVENELLKVSSFYNSEFKKPDTPRKYDGRKLIINGQPSK